MNSQWTKIHSEYSCDKCGRDNTYEVDVYSNPNCPQILCQEDAEEWDSEQTWIDQEIGPRVVGGTYHNGYWGDTYTVEEIYRAPDASQWGMRVRWSDGHTTVHCTGWDAKRDRVVTTATVPERAPAGMLAVRVGSDPWTMVPLDNETDAPCETCHGTGLISDVHQWSDGLGMVERSCPACYDPSIHAGRLARGVCIYCEAPSAPTAAACCVYHLSCCGFCSNGQHARCLRRELGDTCECHECFPLDTTTNPVGWDVIDTSTEEASTVATIRRTDAAILDGLWGITLDGFHDAECGSVDENGYWYGLIRFSTEADTLGLPGMVGAIVETDSYGFKGYNAYETVEALDAAWADCEASAAGQDVEDEYYR